MQTIRHEQTRQPSKLAELRTSLDDFLGHQLKFDQLRTRWITALAKSPEMRNDAVRLLYQQPASQQLTEEHALSLKRIAETAFDDGIDDWTIDFDGDKSEALPARTISQPAAQPKTAAISKTTATTKAARAPAGIPSQSVQRHKDSRAQSKPAAAVLLRPGHVIKERFVLEEPLGLGGVGIVYRATDRLRQRADAATAKIALKVLRKDFGENPDFLDALQHEALLAQCLSHPNIVRVYDFHQDGETRFLTMELLEGELLRTLFSRLKPATLPADRALKVIQGMCEGLSYAHACGLVHADFKPGNVFLTKRDIPKILDFGLAYVTAPAVQLADAPDQATSMAQRGVTPAYASCNRLEGGTPVFSDDVYSLSCVIYELLAGHHPYQRKSALVARELRLKPKRIDSLTNLQWRTLAAGLEPSRQDRVTELHDLQVAFAPPEQTRPSRVPKAKKTGGTRAAVTAMAGLLSGAVILLAMHILGIELVPSRYVEMARQSELTQTLQATLGIRNSAEGARQASVATNATADQSPVIDSGATAQLATSEIALPLSESTNGDVGPDAILSEPEEATAIGVDDSLTSVADLGYSPIDNSAITTPGANTFEPVVALDQGFQFGSASYVISESASALALQINRQGDLATEASVEWTTIAGSAEPQVDFVVADRSRVFFAAGEKTKTIFIPIVADSIVEGNEYFRIALSRPGDGMVLAEPYTATVTIIDDEA